ncbi:hypothetical protein N7468_008565 [Penicillium chermesinum]|uniref:Uncharacterized protein n=1 Tax=Penicillium chermesinum TaxID=63820 RepID=A0A9W9NQH1_9EURO|nr:uncharacterized protein N7468_008565 [Penicillium chermesinum]KAJ5224023.1 hypothetical protein N7468_008565 [Penicillium chermesinum]KAJ6155160.1 hypothetical protein N7470_005726 [Penicillium chermesinum]
MALHHQYETVYFRYDLTTGQSLYILQDPIGDLRNLLHKLEDGLHGSAESYCVDSQCRVQGLAQLHPFTMQFVIMFHALSTQTAEMEAIIKSLLWIETQLHQGSLFEIAESDRFSRYIQRLHEMSRKLITLEHSNLRDASHIKHFIQDHQRLGKLSRRYQSPSKIDRYAHERVKDDLLSLRDFCDDRHRLIVNLRQRTNNFITLLYNLITGHDSSINLHIATQNATIASEARKDSSSMRIIAAVTLLYLPPTFVCSLFGTNLIALDTSKGTNLGGFTISTSWWIYFAFAVPLTAATVCGFLWWRRTREQSNIGSKSVRNSELFHGTSRQDGVYGGYV